MAAMGWVGTGQKLGTGGDVDQDSGIRLFSFLSLPPIYQSIVSPLFVICSCRYLLSFCYVDVPPSSIN